MDLCRDIAAVLVRQAAYERLRSLRGSGPRAHGAHRRRERASSRRASAAFAVAIIVLGSAGGGHGRRAGAAGRAPAEAELAGRYSDLVWRFHGGTGADPVHDLEQWNPTDVRRALGVVARVLRTPSEPLDPLLQFASPETRQRVAAATAKGGVEAAQAIFVRSAAVLHLDTAASLWREGDLVNAAVHVSFVDADLEPLLSPRDSETARLECRAGGAVPTGAVQFSAALHHYETCLDRHAGDAWLLLGRGSTFESAARAIAVPCRDSRAPAH